LRTTDGGGSWKDVSNPVPGGSVTAISFINAREGWLLASFGRYTGSEPVAVYRSTDGGESWTSIAAHEIHSDGSTTGGGGLGLTGSKTSITFFNSMRGLIPIAAFNGKPFKPYVYVTQDGGNTWQQQSLPLPPLYTHQLQPPSPDVSSDWESIHWPPQVFTAKDGIMRADYVNNHPGVANAIKPIAVFYVTHDSGATWKYTTPLPLKRGEHGRLQTSSDFADVNHGWLADSNAHTLYATMNSGRQWTTLRSNDFPTTRQLNFISPQVGWAIWKAGGETKSTSPSLFKTVDGGRTWTPVTYTISRQ